MPYPGSWKSSRAAQQSHPDKAEPCIPFPVSAYMEHPTSDSDAMWQTGCCPTLLLLFPPLP